MHTALLLRLANQPKAGWPWPKVYGIVFHDLVQIEECGVSTTTIDSPRISPEETRNNRFNRETFNGLGLDIFQGLDMS